ncbi:MAG: VCBS repeat-containing protein [Myxococcales bacterium]|nr:VCBS repeat-containing protein [Myxococcales bacterium]
MNGDQFAEVVFATGGKLSARTPTGATLWQTPTRGFQGVVGTADLDGDGKVELLTRTTNQVVVVDSSNGALAWVEPATDLGTLSGVRVGDLDGDGRLDVLTQECGCCAVNNGASGYVYSFSGGLSAPKKIYTLPSIVCGNSNSTTLFTAASGGVRLLYASSGALDVVDVAAGKSLATAPGLSPPTHLSRCVPRDVDGAAGEELVCFLSTADYSAGTGHKAMLVRFDEVLQKLELSWSVDVGKLDARVTVGANPVADLDGDGAFEVVVSGEAADGSPSTYVLDAKSGQSLSTLAGERVVGAAELGPASAFDIVTTSNNSLSGYSFTRTPTPKLTQRWTLLGRRSLTQIDFDLARRSSIAERLVTADLDGDSQLELATSNLDQTELAVYRVSGAQPMKAASHTVAGGAALLRAWSMPPLDKPYPQLAIARTDGRFTALDAALVPTGDEIEFGGYYASGGWRQLEFVPVAATLENDPAQSIVVPDSRGATVRLDTKDAGLADKPTPAWSKSNTLAPTIASTAQGPIIACRALVEPVTDPPNHEIRALSPAGSILWTKAIERSPLNDIVVAKVDADEVPDFIVQWGAPADTVLHTRALSGKDGASLWNGPDLNPGPTRLPAGLAAVDWDGNGRDDVVFQHYVTQVLRGSDGTVLASGGPGAAYFMPLLADLTGDGKKDVIYQGGFLESQAWGHDLSTMLWSTNPADRPFPYGAIAICPGGATVLTEAAAAVPGQLRNTVASGTVAGTSKTVFLAGGQLFATGAAAASGAPFVGALGSTVVHQNLTGAGHPSAVVGSTDGWLYLVDVCAGKLDYAIDFGWPVGAAVLADTDGDGNDDIIVSVADGYLYDLRQPAIDGPTFVWDTDPVHGITDADVDDVETVTTLSGKWGAVSGATSYQVAVVDQGTGDRISEWKDVGAATAATVAELQLADGDRYRIAVRAMKGQKRSPDVLSDSVAVHFPGAADGGADAGPDGGTDAGPDASQDAGQDGAPDAPGPDGSGNDEILSGRACTCEALGRDVAADWRAAAILMAGAAAGLRRTYRPRASERRRPGP